MGIINLIKKIWPLATILALWFLFSAPYFVKGLVPFPSDYLVSFFPPWNASYAMPVKNNAMPDVITQIYPWKKLTIESWKQGMVPLWNPYAFSGTVHAANYQSAVFSPINGLFFLLSFIDAWSMAVLLQPLLAGIFMYVLLREFAISKTGSLLGALGYMFCGFMTTWMAYATLGYAIVPLPLILFGIHRFLKKPHWGPGALVSFGVWFSLVSGHFQISVYCILFTIAFIIYLSLVQKALVRGAVLFLFVFLGIGLAAPQLMLTFDAFGASVRGMNTAAKEVIPWQYILTFLAPDFYGNPVTRNDWFGHYAEWGGYIGVIPFLLALFGVFYSRHTYRIFFMLTALISLLLAYASPLAFLLFFLKIPVLSTSAASRIIILVSFSLLVLSGMGCDALFGMWKKQSRRPVLWFVGSIGVLFFIIWISLFVFHWLPDEWLMVAKRNFILPTALSVGCLGLMTAGFIRQRVLQTGVLIALVVLTLFDLYRFSSKWMPFEKRADMYPQTELIGFLTARASHNRVFGNLGGEVGNYFRVELIDGYDAMYQGRYGEFINTLRDGTVAPGERSVVSVDKYGTYTADALRLLNVGYIVHRISDGHNVWAFPYWQYPEGVMKSVYKDAYYEVFEYTDALPRAFAASSYILKTDKEAIIDALFTLDLKNVLVLETAPDITPQEGEGQVDITSYKPGAITLHTETSVPKLIFVSETYDPGWKATVDGVETDVYRADYDFLAVGVPAGSHDVALRYAPDSFRLGLVVAAGALGAIGVLLLLAKKL